MSPGHAARPHWLEARSGKQETSETPGVVSAARVGPFLAASEFPAIRAWGKLMEQEGVDKRAVWMGRDSPGQRSARQSRSLLKSRPHRRAFPDFPEHSIPSSYWRPDQGSLFSLESMGDGKELWVPSAFPGTLGLVRRGCKSV